MQITVTQAEALKAKVEKILTWRWTEPPEEEGKMEELDHTHSHPPPKNKVGYITKPCFPSVFYYFHLKFIRKINTSVVITYTHIH